MKHRNNICKIGLMVGNKKNFTIREINDVFGSLNFQFIKALVPSMTNHPKNTNKPCFQYIVMTERISFKQLNNFLSNVLRI